MWCIYFWLTELKEELHNLLKTLKKTKLNVVFKPYIHVVIPCEKYKINGFIVQLFNVMQGSQHEEH